MTILRHTLTALAVGVSLVRAAAQTPGGDLPAQTLPRTPSGVVEVRGDFAPSLPPGTALRVYVAGAAAPVQGRYERKSGELVFVPYFPFAPGQRYRVEWTPMDGAGTAPRVTYFRLPGHAAARPRVLAIAPSAPVIPANALRFYVTFSGSMRGRFDRSWVHLTDSNSTWREVGGAFMSFGQELWSADGHRLTLLLDPGRIKRGVTANLAEGPPLRQGRAYALSVVPPGGAGRRILFRVSTPIRTPLSPAAWRLTPPRVGTRAPLILRFDRVMDSALLRNAITVRSAQGRPVAGTAKDSDGEREWLFAPASPWGRSVYRAVFGADLEDVSGNRIGEALDHDVGTAPPKQNTLDLPFRAR